MTEFYVVGKIVHVTVIHVLIFKLIMSFTHIYILINICKAYIHFFLLFNLVSYCMMTQDFSLLQKKPR